MLPTRKISETILDFGSILFDAFPEEFDALPEKASRAHYESTAKIVVCAWNAVVFDRLDKTDKWEKAFLLSISETPKEINLIMRHLIKRKKEEFSNDLRSVGHHEIIYRNGELRFRAEARGDIERIKASLENREA